MISRPYLISVKQWIWASLVQDLRVELGAPARVLDVQDALVQGLQPLQAPLQVPLDLQHVAAELWTLAAAEDRQRPLLAVLPAGKLMLTVTHLVGGGGSSISLLLAPEVPQERETVSPPSGL